MSTITSITPQSQPTQTTSGVQKHYHKSQSTPTTQETTLSVGVAATYEPSNQTPQPSK